MVKSFTLNGHTAVDYGGGGEQSELCLVGWGNSGQAVLSRDVVEVGLEI